MDARLGGNARGVDDGVGVVDMAFAE
jgi:hypothetical protein